MEQFLAFYFLIGGGCREVCAMRHNDKPRHVYVENADDFARWVTYFLRDPDSNVYCTLNPVIPTTNMEFGRVSIGSRTTDKMIDCRTLIFIDLDPERESGVCATDNEVAEAEKVCARITEYLTEAGLHFSVMFSGNGYYILLRCDLPATSDIPEDLLDHLQQFNTDAVKIDTSVSNAARLFRVAGTENRKREAPGRPRRTAEILTTDTTVNSTELLCALIGSTLPAVTAPVDLGFDFSSIPAMPTIQTGYWVKDFAQLLKDHGYQFSTKEKDGQTCFNLSSCPGCRESEGRPHVWVTRLPDGDYVETLFCNRSHKCGLKAFGKDAFNMLFGIEHRVEVYGKDQRYFDAADDFRAFLHAQQKPFLVMQGRDIEVFQFQETHYVESNERAIKNEALKYLESGTGTKLPITKAKCLAEIHIARESRFPIQPGTNIHTGEREEHLLPCMNGMLDLKALARGEACIRPHSPALYLTAVCPVNANPELPLTPTVAQALEIMFPDEHDRKQLQQSLGFAISRIPTLQHFFVHRGKTNSGKGMTGRLLSAVLGSSQTCGLSNVNALSDSKSREELYGKKVCFIGESDNNIKQAAINALKAITGDDSVDYNRKYRNIVSTTEHPVPIIQTNHHWYGNDESSALYRRSIFQYFARQLSEKEIDELRDEKGRTLEEQIIQNQDNLDSFFAWLVRGWVEVFLNHSIYVSSSNRELIEEARTEGSPVTQFLNDYCEPVAGEVVTRRDLFDSFRNSPFYSEHALTMADFGTAITSSWGSVRTGWSKFPKQRVFKNLKLKEQATAI